MSATNKNNQKLKIEYFSTLEICKKLGIERGRLREWMTGGWITPTVPAEKQGKGAKFTLFDVYCVELFQVLLSRGIERKTAGEIVTLWNENIQHRAPEMDLIIIKQMDVDSDPEIIPVSIKGKKINPKFLKGTTLLSVTARGLEKSGWDFTPYFNMFNKNEKNYKEWESVYIFNFTKIRNRVNALLKE